MAQWQRVSLLTKSVLGSSPSRAELSFFLLSLCMKFIRFDAVLNKKKLMSHSLTILIWGSKLQKGPPRASEFNVDVSRVPYYRLTLDLDLDEIKGDDDIMYSRLSKTKAFQQMVNRIVRKIEKQAYKTISINCQHGQHRSRAIARGVAARLKQKVTIEYL